MASPAIASAVRAARLEDASWPTVRVSARSTDPATSHAAAASVADLNAKQRAVLDALRSDGPLTDEALVEVYGSAVGREVRVPSTGELYLVPDQSPSGVRTRRHELVKAGVVRAVGESRTGSGRRCLVWGVVA